MTTRSANLLELVTERFKREREKALARGMSENKAFFSWGGILDRKTYFRHFLFLLAGTLVLFFVAMSVASAMVSTFLPLSFGGQPCADGLGLGCAVLAATGPWISWFLGMFQSLLMILCSLVISVFSTSLAERRIRDIRGTLDLHFEIVAVVFVLSLVPVLGWLVFFGAIVLAFIPGTISDAAVAAATDKS